MNDFQSSYLDLLQRQVDEEIKFLVENGHSTKQNYKPCQFCYEARNGSYSCNRLNELRQFQSRIAVEIHQPITNKRHEIGFESELPKLLQPL